MTPSRGLPAGVPGISLLFSDSSIKNWHFYGDWPGVPETPGCPRVFQKSYVMSSGQTSRFCALLSRKTPPILKTWQMCLTQMWVKNAFPKFHLQLPIWLVSLLFLFVWGVFFVQKPEGLCDFFLCGLSAPQDKSSSSLQRRSRMCWDGRML